MMTMKKKYTVLGLLLAAVVTLSLTMMTTGCKTTEVINPDGSTNIVKVVDPVKLQQAKDALVPVVSSVLRRAIARSPEHAAEIGNYSRAIGQVFCKMVTEKKFTPDYLIDAADKDTQGLQANVPPEIIDMKNAAIALYKMFLSDQVMVAIPDNAWAMNVSQLFCESIDQALKDSGQAGVK